MPINIDGSKGIRQNTTETTQIPVGTTAQRPSNPAAGMMRFNTDQGFVEWYDDVGDRWLATSSFPGVAATGGTVTDITQDGQLFRVHTFTSDGTFDVARGGEVEYLIVGGGGSGGNTNAGGGGAGGVVIGSVFQTAGSYTVTVGLGGPTPGTMDTKGNNGDNSSVFNITALGGGGGGIDDDRVSDPDGRDGGSGGGGGSQTDSNQVGSGLQPTTSSGGFGNNGGFGSGSSSTNGGGGGGGAAEIGKNGPDGDGGEGITSDINGTSTVYGDGGGGGHGNTTTGGSGRGGQGFASGSATAAEPNSGSGGGGSGGGSDARGGDGGSGIVILRYRIG